MPKSNPNEKSAVSTPSDLSHLYDRGARYVSKAEPDDVVVRDSKSPTSTPRGLWGEAWLDLRKRPLFWASAVIILLAAWSRTM